jgi:hypothetical protein
MQEAISQLDILNHLISLVLTNAFVTGVVSASPRIVRI